MFQTFSRNDLPGEAALSRGRSVFKKKKKREKGRRKKEKIVSEADGLTCNVKMNLKMSSEKVRQALKTEARKRHVHLDCGSKDADGARSEPGWERRGRQIVCKIV